MKGYFVGKKPTDHPAYGPLNGVLHILDRNGGKLTPAVIKQTRELVQTAVDVLMEPDPLKQRIAFILLSIKQSTEIRTIKGHLGKTVQRVSIIDHDLYTWAVTQVHELVRTVTQ